jgi:uncharacterized protein YprB with RNaseH-like and TPR domain
MAEVILTEDERSFALQRIGKKIKERAERIKEHEITQKEKYPSNFFSPSILNQDYRKFQELKKELLKEYAGKNLEDVIAGEEYKTQAGTCYRIETCEKLMLHRLNADNARERILSNLKLLYGIGEATEENLKTQGYKTIEDLVEHPRFGSEAEKFMAIDMCDTLKLLTWMGHWLPKSHPAVLYAARFRDEEDFIILDIETMGLHSLPIILCGVARISGNHLLITQYLLRDIPEEPGALSGFLSHIQNSILITFNGKTFDVPFIRERLAYYSMMADIQNPHFDLLHFSRRAFRKKVPDCRLTTLEEYLFGVKRENDVPSALIPQFYETYRETKNVGPLIPIIEHNKLDITTLAHIFSELYEESTWQ